jgi:predicted O-methyltransferase YrrM
MSNLTSFTKDFTPTTDKYDLGYIDGFYSGLLTPLKDEAINLLEIGIYFGHSIMLWHAYFPKASIYCADINECASINHLDRVTQYTENAYTPEFLDKLNGKSFDIIIDDGPHTLESMEYFLTHYPQLLNAGGVLILEDIINPMWTTDLLKLVPQGYTPTVHHMAGRQKTQDLHDLWSNGLDVITVKKD